MFRFLRESPGLTRALALSVCAVLIAEYASFFGGPVQWGTAIIYGITVATSMRWPIIMGGTGVRVVITTGLMLEALWHYGLPTAIVVMLVEFGARILVLYQGRYYWEWYRPVLAVASFTSAYGLQLLVQGGSVLDYHSGLSHLATPAITMSYGFWILLNAYWAWLRPKDGRLPAHDFLRGLQQTWWVPLVFLAVAGVTGWLSRTDYPLTVLVCIVLIWLQAQIGPVFTTLNQDMAIARLVQTTPPQSAAQRFVVHRVARTAHTLGRSLGLSAHELRLLGYAALLQESPSESSCEAPLWLLTAPGPEQAAAIERRIKATVEVIETDGALQEVAYLIRYRYASYDGQGYPDVAGDTIPVGSQVLAAANAVVWLTGQGSEPTARSSTAAVDWLRRNAGARFSPRLMAAMSQLLVDVEPTVDVARGLPEAVRQLQGLVGESDPPSPLLIGLRRFWNGFRWRSGIAPDLPAEVQAVARLATYFASSTQATETAQITAEAVGQLVGGKVAVALCEGPHNELSMRIRAAYAFTAFSSLGIQLDLYGGPLSRAMLEQTPYQVSDLREVQGPLAQEVARTEGVRSALFVPLVYRGLTTGMIFIGLTRYHWFTPREVGLIHLMAGQAAAALENARLITEAEERLEHISSLKAFTDTLLDSLSTSILVVDPEGHLVLANAVARERFGEELALEIGQPLPDPLANGARLSGALCGEVTPEEDVVWGSATLEMQAVPLKDERGVLTGAICLARDVTQVRTMQQQVRRVEKLAAIGELAAGAAHEIRNPLTSIRGFIQLLQARASRADGDYFQIILNEIDRIDGIIRDMLLLARPAAVVRTETDLAALADEVLLLNRSELERQNITVMREVEPGVGPVALDTNMFRQLLLNLVINGMQAMPYGGTLRVTVRPDGSDCVALAISDTGVGIAPENLKRLFVPFFTTKEEGTGLGLALCYSIVQAHGGKIDVQSQVGMGTTFTIKLPVK